MIEIISNPIASSQNRNLFGAAFPISEVFVIVHSEIEAVVAELSGFATGAGGPIPDRIVEISFLSNPARVQQLRGAMPRSKQEVFAKHDFSFWLWNTPEGKVYLSHRGFSDSEPFAILQTDVTRFTVIASSGHTDAIRAPLRVVREVALRAAEDSGACLFHSACVVTGQRGWLICGKSGAGKTTMVNAILRNSSRRYLSNDKTLIRTSLQTVDAIDWPVAARLGFETLRAAGLESRVAEQRPTRVDQASYRQKASDEHCAARVWGSRDKIELTPREYAALISCGLARRASIVGLIRVHLTLDARPTTLTPLTANDKLGALEEGWFAHDDPDFGTDWLSLRRVPRRRVEDFREAFMALHGFQVTCSVDQLDACMVLLLNKMEGPLTD